MDTAAEVFLLLTNDEGGSASWGTQSAWALSAATIADLLMEERIGLGEQKDPKVRVVDPTPTGRTVLDKVLCRCREGRYEALDPGPGQEAQSRGRGHR